MLNKEKCIVAQLYIKCKVEKYVKKIMQDEAGMGMVEIALIIVIIIALGLTFKQAINDFLKTIFLSFDIAGYK